MKKIIIPITILTAALSLSSCQDFLTKTPETSLSQESFFYTRAELDLWANAIYNDLMPGAADLAEQNADDNCSGSSLSAIQRGTRVATSKSWSEDTWKPLRKINMLLENNKCEDASVRDQYNGVAYFFRALFYYEKVRQYGDIPWYDHVLASDNEADLKKPRDPRGYVMLMVLRDLDKAYELLPAQWESDPVYHLSKDAALALKSRAALFEGTFRKYHAGTVYVPQDEVTYSVNGDDITVSSTYFLQQAADAAGKLVGTRSLYNGNERKLANNATDASYREYFLLEAAESSETILSRRYSGLTPTVVRQGIQFDYKNHRRSASRRFVNHYLLKDGNPIQSRAGYETESYYDSFRNRDPRMAQTLHGPSYLMADVEPNNDPAVIVHPTEQLSWERTFNGYRVIKYISDLTHESATSSTTDYPVIRYPEVLLNYAEAKAELGELTAEDLAKTINVIRARVGMPGLNAVPTTPDNLMAQYYPHAQGSQKAAILEVRRERTVELFCEGFRQWDLLRWGEGDMLTPTQTAGFQGIYIKADEVGTQIDLDKDGKPDLYLYTGSKASGLTVPSTNQIELGGNYTLSEGTKGYLTYWAAEEYKWKPERDYLWPIPADVRTASGFAITQNPGWDDGLDQ